MLLATGSASAYQCSVLVNVNVGDTTAQITGSDAVPNSDVTLSSDCFVAPVTVPTSSTGTFSATASLKPGLPAGTNCPVAADGQWSCGSFSFNQRTVPTTTPTTTPTTQPPQSGNGNDPAEVTTTTVVEVLGNNTDNSDPGEGATSGPAAKSETGKLPFTGMETAGLVGAGALMIAGGVVLVGSVRRRQTA